MTNVLESKDLVKTLKLYKNDLEKLAEENGIDGDNELAEQLFEEAERAGIDIDKCSIITLMGKDNIDSNIMGMLSFIESMEIKLKRDFEIELQELEDMKGKLNFIKGDQ